MEVARPIAGVRGGTAAIAALAGATARDLTRRPGVRLLFAAAAVLLLVLPATTVRALDDGGSLARELIAATVLMATSLAAAIAGAIVVNQEAGFGAGASLRVSSWSIGTLLLGRLCGALLAVGVALIGLTVAGSLALLWHRGSAGGLAMGDVSVLLSTSLVSATLAITLGMAIGAATGARSGAVLAAVTILLLRAAPASATELTWRALLPDPGRLDVSRQLARAALPPASALILAAVAAIAHAAALWMLASYIAARRRNAGGA